MYIQYICIRYVLSALALFVGEVEDELSTFWMLGKSYNTELYLKCTKFVLILGFLDLICIQVLFCVRG